MQVCSPSFCNLRCVVKTRLELLLLFHVPTPQQFDPAPIPPYSKIMRTISHFDYPFMTPLTVNVRYKRQRAGEEKAFELMTLELKSEEQKECEWTSEGTCLLRKLCIKKPLHYCIFTRQKSAAAAVEWKINKHSKWNCLLSLHFRLFELKFSRAFRIRNEQQTEEENSNLHTK